MPEMSTEGPRCLSGNLNQLRLNNYFCDFHLISASGDAIPAHRCVLSACSAHLHALILQNNHTLHLKYPTETISRLISAIYLQCSKHSERNFIDDNFRTLARELHVETLLGSQENDLCGFLTGESVEELQSPIENNCIAESGNAASLKSTSDFSWKTCKYCSQFKGKRKGSLDFHMKKCEKAVSFCERCHEPFITEAEKDSHDCRRKERECEDCGKVILSRDGMRRHKMSHSGVKKAECKTCGKSFSRPSHLQLHIKRMHGTSRPFVCVICGQAFALQFDLNHHVRVVHDSKKPEGNIESSEELFACGECNLVIEARCISEHQEIHSAEKTLNLPKILPKFPTVITDEETPIIIEQEPPMSELPPLASSDLLLLNEDVVLRESIPTSPVHCDLLEESHAASNLLVNQFLDTSSIAANLAQEMSDQDDLSFSLASLPLSHTFGSFDAVSMAPEDDVTSPFNDKFYPSIIHNKDDF